LLFVGDDWAEDHHDVEIQDETGRRLAKARLPEGISGIARLHGLVGRFLSEDGDVAEVKIGIETDRGPWVAALVSSGYQVYAINPLQSARARQGHDVSGAKSDAGDAHVLADLVRTQSHQLRTVAGDSQQAGATKVLTRMHQSLIWDRTRQVLRLRSALREFFPAALVAYEDLASPDVLELLTKAPEPQRAAALSRAQITAALNRAGRRDREAKTTAIMAALRTEHLTQPPLIAAAYGATVRALAAVITTSKGRSRPVLVSTRTLRSTSASPDWGPSWAPGCSQSSATTPPATPVPEPVRTTPGPAPSPRPRVRRKSSWPDTCETNAWPMPCTVRLSAR
jgi:transposase